MKHLLLVIAGTSLGLSTAATAAPPTSTPPTADEPQPAEPSSFDAARQAYLLGHIDQAREAFAAIVATSDPRTLSDQAWAESWIFLGEIAWFDGEQERAKQDFRAALERVPDWKPSPYDHPMEIIGILETTRAALLSERAKDPLPPPTPPMPWWGYAPFGVGQFKSGRPVRGAIYATLQVGLAAASIGAWVEIDRSLKGFDTLPTAGQQQAREHARQLRDFWSIPTATAFYVVWGISALDAGLDWKKSHHSATPRAMIVLPAPGGASVAASWRF